MADELFEGAVKSFLVFGLIHAVGHHTVPASVSKDMKRADLAYWASSVASTLHGVYVSSAAWKAMSDGGYWTSEDLELVTPAALHCCQVYLGYLAADTIPLLLHAKEWAGSELYLVHHALSLFSWSLMSMRGQLLAIAVGLLLLEATAPFTNGRWFMSKCGITSGPIFMANGVLFALSFLVLRVLLMGGLLVRYAVVLRGAFFALPTSTYLTVLGSYAFGYPLQLFWFNKIVKGLLKLLSGKKKPT